MTPREFTAVEMMTCIAARLFEDNKAYFIGFGMPQIAAVLAQKLIQPTYHLDLRVRHHRSAIPAPL